MKRKLDLIALEGNEKCYLEIEKYPNGDLFIGLKGQDTKGNYYFVKGQIPNSISGGGKNKDYEKLCEIFKVLEK